MKNFLNAPILRELGNITDQMYRLGWNERNGGNISILLDNDEVTPHLESDGFLRRLPLAVPFPSLAGRYFLITGTGKYFRHISSDPENCLGLIQISPDGAAAHLLWGFRDGGSFTSEAIMHLAAHQQRLMQDPSQRVVMHAHPCNTVSMTHVHAWDEKAFTQSLWSTCTECIVIFPEGVALLPWMVSSNAAIGLESAEKFKNFRILIWALHGCTVTGASLDEAFGLMETVEKGAEIYMKTYLCPNRRGIDLAALDQIAQAFGLNVHPGWLTP